VFICKEPVNPAVNRNHTSPVTPLTNAAGTLPGIQLGTPACPTAVGVEHDVLYVPMVDAQIAVLLIIPRLVAEAQTSFGGGTPTLVMFISNGIPPTPLLSTTM
jgi:hypothetical protein